MIAFQLPLLAVSGNQAMFEAPPTSGSQATSPVTRGFFWLNLPSVAQIFLGGLKSRGGPCCDLQSKLYDILPFLYQMLSILLFGLLDAIPTPPPIMGMIKRIDRIGDAYSNDFKAAYLKAFDVPVVDTVSKALSPESSFILDLSCPGFSKANCDKARIGLLDAGRRIAQNLIITKPIKIKATFNSFCKGQPLDTCDQANVLGAARAASSFVVEQGGKNVMLSQGLIKQLKTNIQAPFSDADIIANFNADYDWFFRDGSQNTISPTQSDFVYVSCHEITHGLGFGSGFLSYGDVFQGAAQPGYLAPLFLGASEDPDFNGKSLVKSLEPSDIYDTFLESKTTNFNTIISDISSFEKDGVPAAEFLQDFEESGTPFAAAKSAYAQATSGTLNFKAKDGTIVDLFAPRKFQQGSSISHVSPDNSETSDFLMIPALAPGITIEQAMAKAQTKSLYGKKTLAVMKSIGWPTIDSPIAANVRLSTKFGSSFYQKPVLYIVLMVLSLAL